MPVSHSHQLLCVSRSPLTTTVRRAGFAGSVTSHISCADPPKLRSRYTLLLSACGSALPSHTRTICAPPDSPPPGLRRLAGNVREVLRPLRIGDVDDRRAVVLVPAGQRIGLRRAVVADVGDPALALLVDASAGRRCAPAGRCSPRAPCCSFPLSAARRCRRPPARAARARSTSPDGRGESGHVTRSLLALFRKLLADVDVRSPVLDAGGAIHRALADDLGEQEVGELFDLARLQRRRAGRAAPARAASGRPASCRSSGRRCRRAGRTPASPCPAGRT